MRISDCSDVCSSDLADIGPYLQGRGGKGDDPFQRQTPQPQGPELGLPGASFRAGIFHHHLSEAEAGENPLHEALPFPVLAENPHSPPVHEPEIANVRWNINRPQSAHDPDRTSTRLNSRH